MIVNINKVTYHGYISVGFEELRYLGQLVLEVVDPDVAYVGALI